MRLQLKLLRSLSAGSHSYPALSEVTIGPIGGLEVHGVQHLGRGKQQLRHGQIFCGTHSGASQEWCPRLSLNIDLLHGDGLARDPAIGVEPIRLFKVCRIVHERVQACANLSPFEDVVTIDRLTALLYHTPWSCGDWWAHAKRLVDDSLEIFTGAKLRSLANIGRRGKGCAYLVREFLVC